MQEQNEVKFDFTKSTPKPVKQGMFKRVFNFIIPTKQISNEVQSAKNIHRIIFVLPVREMMGLDKKHIRNTFDEAISKFNISEDTLAKNKDIFGAWRNIFIGLFFICLGSFVFQAYEGSKIQALGCLSIGLMFGSLALKYGLLSYQIKTRNLCSLKDYLLGK